MNKHERFGISCPFKYNYTMFDKRYIINEIFINVNLSGLNTFNCKGL